MGIELGYLAALSSDMLYLKALMGRIAAASGVAGASLPTIDFAVDMFDRNDQPVLDGYWDTAATNWAIRSRKLIPQGVPTTVTVRGIGGLSTSLTLGFGQLPPGSLQNKGISISGTMQGVYNNATAFTTSYNTQTLYSGTFSAPDLNMKVTFDIPGVPTVVVTSHNITSSADSTTITKNHVAGNYGLCFGDAANRRLGVTGNFAKFSNLSVDAISCPFHGSSPVPAVASVPFGAADLFTPDVTGSMADVTFTPPAVAGLAEISFSDFVSFAHSAIALPAATSVVTTISTPSFGAVSGYTPSTNTPITTATAFGSQLSVSTATAFTGPPLLATGNALVLQAVGDVYVVYLNGVQIYTETGTYMTRTRAGIAQFMQSMLTNLAASGIAASGITSFKAWVNSMPEPVDQTGRGTYAGGALVYNDKYHTAAADGSVTYNPLA